MRFVKIVSSMYEPLQLRNNSLSQKMKQALLISKLIVLLMKIVNIRLHTQLGAETVKNLLSFCGHRVQLRSTCSVQHVQQNDNQCATMKPLRVGLILCCHHQQRCCSFDLQVIYGHTCCSSMSTYVFIHYIFHTCHTFAGNGIINTYFINIATFSNDSGRHGLVNAHTQL